MSTDETKEGRDPFSPLYFSLKGRFYPADGILAIVQINERDVEVRYASPSKGALLLTDTSVEKVTAAVDRAKSQRR